MKYDYLIVGAGLFGATFANLAKRDGSKVLVIEKRNHIAGNIYTEEINGINVHMYGAHIFHTDDKEVWDYVNDFVEFNNYINSPIARINDEIYNLPFNMNTFSKIWSDVVTPSDAMRHIDDERKEISGEPKNLEEQAISLVGRTIYEKLIKGYTEKQWNCECKDLPAFIIKRLPVRLLFDNNYFNDRYQGIPVGGYTKMVEKMLDGVDVKLGEDYLRKRDYYNGLSKKIIYTGAIDEFYDYCLGELGWRSLKFNTKVMDIDNYQGNAVINYTGREVDFTRVIEHKHFECSKHNGTVVTYEYPMDYESGRERYYTINNKKNERLFKKYLELALREEKILFGGRLADYKYYDMDDTIRVAMDKYILERGKNEKK